MELDNFKGEQEFQKHVRMPLLGGATAGRVSDSSMLHARKSTRSLNLESPSIAQKNPYH